MSERLADFTLFSSFLFLFLFLLLAENHWLLMEGFKNDDGIIIIVQSVRIYIYICISCFLDSKRGWTQKVGEQSRCRHFFSRPRMKEMFWLQQRKQRGKLRRFRVWNMMSSFFCLVRKRPVVVVEGITEVEFTNALKVSSSCNKTSSVCVLLYTTAVCMLLLYKTAVKLYTVLLKNELDADFFPCHTLMYMCTTLS